MENKKQEIEEMARVICGFTNSGNKCDCSTPFKDKGIKCIAYLICEELHNAGYGKVKKKQKIAKNTTDIVK